MPIKRRAVPMIGKTVRLSAAEVRQIAQRAKAAGLTFHAYMRLRLLAEDARAGVDTQDAAA
ncbi:MAG: hypothetical protein EKK62_16995 [Acidimicrobiia bacterium]|nr:MAG: hypothetical protein EKK62_16995 [Acidimicrobiia bacterium]